MYLFIYLFICSFIHSIIHLVLMQLSTHIKSLKMIFAPLPIKVQYSQFVLKCFTIFNSNQQKSTDFSPKSAQKSLCSVCTSRWLTYWPLWKYYVTQTGFIGLSDNLIKVISHWSFKYVNLQCSLMLTEGVRLYIQYVLKMTSLQGLTPLARKRERESICDILMDRSRNTTSQNSTRLIQTGCYRQTGLSEGCGLCLFKSKGHCNLHNKVFTWDQSVSLLKN